MLNIGTDLVHFFLLLQLFLLPLEPFLEGFLVLLVLLLLMFQSAQVGFVLRGATKQASFKVSRGPIRRSGGIGAVLGAWSAQDLSPSHIQSAAPKLEN